MFAFADRESLEELKKSPRLHRHALSLMKTVGAAIDLLDDMDSLVDVLKSLGERHIKYRAKKEHFGVSNI